MSDSHAAPGANSSGNTGLTTDLLEFIPDPIFILDDRGVVVGGNGCAERLLGQPRHALAGRRLETLFPGSPALAAQIGQALAGQPTGETEIRFAGRTLEARIRRTGRRLLVLLRDLSALKQAEATLRQSEERFRQITENIHEVFWLRSADDESILYVSPAYEDLYGSPLETLAADRESFLALIHPDDRERVRSALPDREHPTFQEQYRIIRPDGTIRWIAAQIFPILNDDGEIFCLAGVDEDITERRLLEQERAKRLDQLQRLADAAVRVNAETGVDAVLRAITEELRGIIGAHQAVTSLTGQNQLQFISAISLSDKYAAWANYTTPPTGAGIYMLVLEQKRVFRMTQAELEAHPRWRNFSGDAGRHPPMRGWLAAPLVGPDGAVIGILQLSDKDEGEFSEEDEAILLQFAQFASITLDKTHLLEAERRARTIADTLSSANAAITRSLELEQILALLLDYLGRLVPYDGANVMLLEADGRFHARAAHGYDGWGRIESASGWTLDPHEHPLIRRLTDSRQPIKVDDTRTEPGWYSHPDTIPIRSWLGVPLIVEDAIIGLYSLDSIQPNAFTDEHRQIAQALAAPAAFSIQKALLFRQVQSYAAELEERVAERTAELLKANHQLEAMNLAKAKFVSDVSHELRNPIASLSLSFELMKRRTHQQIIERLPDMQEQIDLLLSLTNSILDISRHDLTSGQPVSFAPVDLNELVGRVVEAYRPSAEAASLQLRFIPAADLPLVRGEHHQLAQVATNLISNAIKYTPKGHVEVKTALDAQTGQAALIVEDTGLGIEEEDMAHLFERFYRGSKVRQSTIPGTGLGLPIVHDVVQIHGGSITVESASGRGSRFIVLLPLMGKPAPLFPNSADHEILLP